MIDLIGFGLLAARVVVGQQLSATLLAPRDYMHPHIAALFVETLAHVSKPAYCKLVAHLASQPIDLGLRQGSDAQVIDELLRRTELPELERESLGLSLGLNEFGPAASFNATVGGVHSCGTSGAGEIVYTDFFHAYDYTPSTVVRYAPIDTGESEARLRLQMSGYGAYLDLKRTDYLVIDDSSDTPLQSDDGNKVVPLKANQMSNIGLRAVSWIANADDPLAELEDVSQNFPSRAQRLLAAKVSHELKDSCRTAKNAIDIEAILINGRAIQSLSDGLLPALREETSLMRALEAEGLNLNQSLALLKASKTASQSADRFEVRSPAVLYLNDLGNDEMYSRWPTDLKTLRRPIHAGQLHSLARNLHTLVLSIDLTKGEDIEILDQFSTLVQRGIPIRVGIVPVVDTQPQKLVAAALSQLLAKRSLRQALEFLAVTFRNDAFESAYTALAAQGVGSAMEIVPYGRLSQAYPVDAAASWLDSFGSSSAYANGRRVKRDDSMLQTMSTTLSEDTVQLQQMQAAGEFKDAEDLQDNFLTGANIRFSENLFGERKYLTLDEILIQQATCDKQFDVVLSGAGLAVTEEDFDLQQVCVTVVDGPRRLIVNGRVLSDISKSEISTLLQQEQREIEHYRSATTDSQVTFTNRLLALLRTTSTIRRVNVPLLPTGPSRISVGELDTALIKVEAFLDPLSKKTQQWSTILRTLAAMPNVYLDLQLLPQFNIKELPLKRYYRYVMPAGLAEPIGQRSAEFSGVPSDLMVFGLDVWSSWGLAPVQAAVDLDNLHLGEKHVRAVFEVDHVLLEGHAKEEGSGRPPRGAQVELLDRSTGEVVAETIIMANLGYFQLKARVGSFDLRLKPGRTAEVYAMESMPVEITGWGGLTMRPALSRRPGMEDADVLNDKLTAATTSGQVVRAADKLWKSVKGMLSKSPSSETAMVSSRKHADINIFTVASGHLYERFVYIMCSSVMAHTEHSVKFWFISNFLSPQFRAFIPRLAQELGFEYELITFTWPSWLRGQTEKQRAIWGYKILFLDVMFPLDLEKVIFVDADQVVRTDLIELVNEDLQGKVWGYTPMGDSRTEMEGYRFWKTGYWKEYLQGKPYHISALYVIDLVAFRAQATGDRLRQQYQALSADPASLSNLDQDLPNNMQHQIPIHSLHADWLWCETWCDDASLATAKTIDLCQNPMTKEPKLARARRQLPEWNQYDASVKKLAARVAADAAAAAVAVREGDRVETDSGIQDGADGGLTQRVIAKDGEADGAGLDSIVGDVDAVGQNREMMLDRGESDDGEGVATAGAADGQHSEQKSHDEL